MKKISCTSVGGPVGCDAVMEGETEGEVLGKWKQHFGSEHPEIVADATEEDKKKWVEAHHKTWDAAPDEA